MSAVLAHRRFQAYRASIIAWLSGEHGLPLLLYGGLSFLVTWPMLANFTTSIPGDGYDAYNGLWVMWHVKEALLGNQPLFDLPLLYYPQGGSLLTHVPGPVTGLFALPFWPWGAQAAHNGAVLVSFVLTGYFMYLLARELGQERSVALFAGLLLLLAPMHLAGLLGHTTKVFLGALPLVLLFLHRTLDLSRPDSAVRLSIVATGLALLFTLSHHGLQFIMAGMAIGFFGLAALARASGQTRRQIWRRLLLLALVSTVIVGPLLVAIARAASVPGINVDLNFVSSQFQPDLIEFLTPSIHGRLMGAATERFLRAQGLVPSIETAVSISWVALPLMALALMKRAGGSAKLWLAFALIWILLSLGPSLRVLGRDEFTEYRLPVILPYAFLTELPGLGFLRTPGRFMQMGFVGIAVTAGWGLSWLRGRFPQRARTLTLVAMLLVLIEAWPQPWPQMRFRPVPSFYRQIAQDEEQYAVLDLPITPTPEFPAIMYNANYQVYQMVHNKGVAMGYLSRTYRSHPVFPCLYDDWQNQADLLVNGAPSPCAFHALYDLPRNNYRFVVYHKPQPEYVDYTPGSPGEQTAAAFLARYLAGRTPLVDDELTVVYEVPPTPDPTLLPTALTWGQNWYSQESDGTDSWRWAQSPASVVLSSPIQQRVILEISPAIIHIVPDSQGTGEEGRLRITRDGHYLSTLPISVGETARLPLTLGAGQQTLTLSLEAGNFRPADRGAPDSRWLAFAVRELNLQTTGGAR